jgi:glucosyl-dolichyl phosphate glucuronosyltransferase
VTTGTGSDVMSTVFSPGAEVPFPTASPSRGGTRTASSTGVAGTIDERPAVRESNRRVVGPASVVITCFSQRRWRQLTAAIDSVLAQRMLPSEVIVVVDHNDELMSRVLRRCPDVTVLANRFERGASGARNTGAVHARAPIVAFLDDDATAEPDWLELLLECFDDESVVGVGGGVTAAWAGGQPGWFPDEFGWVIGASYRGMPDGVAEVRNVWALNMAVRTDKFGAVGGFRLGFGKLGGQSRPEDTDLCIRMIRAGGRWLYVPAARVAHHVPAERSTFRFFVRRCFVEGGGKAALSVLVRASPLDAERAYLRTVISQGIGRHLREAARSRRLLPAARAGVIVAGVASAGVGYAHGRLAALV